MSADAEDRKFSSISPTTKPKREELTAMPSNDEAITDPTQVSWPHLVPTMPGHPTLDNCLSFNLPDGRPVYVTVPTVISDSDAAFSSAVIGNYLAALARRTTG